MAPELRHLFQLAGEIVARDLTALQPETNEPDAMQVEFAAEHLNAWMSALNQARLIQAAVFNITEEDMNDAVPDAPTDKQIAVLKIHLWGYLLQLLVEHAGSD